MSEVVQRTRKQVYRLWVNALRSGSYAQGKGCLRSFDGFCCLGVLCDLAARDGGAQWSGPTKRQQFMGGSAFLPADVVWFMDLSHWDLGRLIDMNDEGVAFKEIAAHIETNLMH